MTTSLIIPPGLILVLGGLALPLLARLGLRAAALIVLPLLSLWLVWTLPDGAVLSTPYLGQDLIFVRADQLSRVFATVFAIMGFAGGLYALNQKSTLELAAAFVYAGSAISVSLAGDLVTVFIFWEIMAIASTVVIWSGGESSSRSAGMRYAAIHMLGGALFMAGVAGEVAATGSTALQAMDLSTTPRVLMLAGVLINAAAPPLSAWLADAYPESSWSGMVFLSAFTTKTAVYVLLRGFPGAEILIPIGLFMVFYGIIYAILENDVRRILAYSIVNQVGFMVTAAGIGSEMAINGAAAHAFAHIIYKALLLMAVGSVVLMTGKRKCTELGGLFRSMPLTAVCCIIGALSISAFPFTSGFASKSLISSAAAYSQMEGVWLWLTIASAAVFLPDIKVPWFVFFNRDSGLRPAEPPLNMRLAMILLAVLCIALGVFPRTLYDMLPYAVDYEPNTVAHVVYQLQLLGFAALVFFAGLTWLQPRDTITLDVDWLWRRPGRTLAAFLDQFSGYTWQWVADRVTAGAERLYRLMLSHHGPEGIFGRAWPTGLMAFWTTVMLGAVVILSYF